MSFIHFHAYSTIEQTFPRPANTFTVDPATNVLSSPGNQFYEGQLLFITSSGSLPDPLANNPSGQCPVYVYQLNGADFKVTTSQNSTTPVDFTNAGSGTLTATPSKWTKVFFNGLPANYGGKYDAASSRFTPGLQGMIDFQISVGLSSDSGLQDGEGYEVHFVRNGNFSDAENRAFNFWTKGTGFQGIPQISGKRFCSATDYFEVYIIPTDISSSATRKIGGDGHGNTWPTTLVWSGGYVGPN